MGESAKAVLVVLLIIFAPLTALFWLDGGLGLSDVLCAAITIASLGLLLWSMLRRDKAPDFLRRYSVGRYFECNGFTFNLAPHVIHSTCELLIFFQNRHARPCQAQVIVKPAQGFFLARNVIDHVVVGIACEGGAFGMTSVPWGIRKSYQGQWQTLEVAASVRYPDGKGEMLRFRDGVPVKGPDLTAWQVTMTVAAAMGGMIVLHSPAKVRVRLPAEVAETVPVDSPIVTRTLWRPGDSAEHVLPKP